MKEASVMEFIPWYAWIVLVAIVVGGLVQIVRIARQPHGGSDDSELRARVVSLEQRLERGDRR